MQGRFFRRLRAARSGGLLVLFVLSLLVAACSPSNISKGTVPERAISGKLTFHDTDLPVVGAVTLGDHRFVTEDGRFSVALQPGNYPYELMTLLGPSLGSVDVPAGDLPGDSLRLSVPAFPGWREDLYEQMGFGAGRNFTVRWPRGRRVTVWIEEHSETSTRAAERALVDWEGLLNDALTFVRVEDPREADMTMRFVPSFLLPGDGTVGTCTRWYALSTGLLLRGEIQIARTWADRIGLHRHEIGHCIGLGHSPNSDHLMYPVLYNDTATVTERDMARLLYALPPKSPRLLPVPNTGQENDFALRPPPSNLPLGDDVVVETVR